MKKNIQITVLGAGNMGTSLAVVLAKNGYKIKLWNWGGEPEVLKNITSFRINKKYLPNIIIPKRVVLTPDLSEAVNGADIIFLATATSVAASVIKSASARIRLGTTVVDTTKGMPTDSCEFVTDMLARILPPGTHVAALAGPAIARQIADGEQVAMVAASASKHAALLVQEVLSSKNVRIKISHDVIGVKVSSLCKNAMAIGMGVCDGLGVSSNTKAAILTAGLGEMADLCAALGGDRATVYGLAGIGDLIGTALASESRNRRYGEFRGRGFGHERALKEVKQTVEGIGALDCLVRLADDAKAPLVVLSAINKWILSSRSPSRAKVSQLFALL